MEAARVFTKNRRYELASGDAFALNKYQIANALSDPGDIIP
jgi:hypothetical protein